jgi:hypothetical protein
MARHLQGYFTAIYYFPEEKVGFSESVTVWSMFYLPKNLRYPHAKIAEYINTFFEREIVAFRSLKASGNGRLRTLLGRAGGTLRK